MTWSLAIAIAAWGSPSAQAAHEVNLPSLLSEMTDMGRLARRPSPGYFAAQASSYDRASVKPGEEAWFANADAGKFVREERVEGRLERVMADLKGPGAVVRIWSANPAGVIRFYFDGEQNARFAWPMADLLGGKVEPFADPLAYFSARGANLYFPIPYARSLKITVDDSGNDGSKSLYFHVGYRTYPPTAAVRSLTREALDEARPLIARTADELALGAHKRLVAANLLRARTETLFLEAPVLEHRGPGAITHLAFRFEHHDPVPNLTDLGWEHPLQMHNALRQVRLVAEFDGETCVDVPLPDFFSSSAGGLPFATQALAVTADGWMVSKFVMPFGRSAKVRLIASGGPRLRVTIHSAVSDHSFGEGSYHFHAQFLSDRLRTRPFRDMEFLNARGEGLFVGASLHVANPTGTWWGEGDEKVYVDGESFPSTFGTGTEDYFGYAWCDPTPFDRPYHAQPRCDGPGNLGHTNVLRLQTFDPIPFRESLRFDIELWHWADVEVDFDRVAYWYARPGTARPLPSPGPPMLTHIPLPQPVKGAIEGETAPIVQRTGGVTELQAFGELSSGQQLWWRDAQKGDKLILKIPVSEDGEYVVSGHFCMARDYGIHRLRLGGTVLQESLDFYSSALEWKVLELGKVRLRAGEALFEVESLGHRPDAVPRNMFGLDYLLLKKVDENSL
jgi:hypothetical protein